MADWSNNGDPDDCTAILRLDPVHLLEPVECNPNHSFDIVNNCLLRRVNFAAVSGGAERPIIDRGWGEGQADFSRGVELRARKPPGGNITGFVFQQLELAQKQVELLNQAFLNRDRLAMLFDAQSADQFRAAEQAAKTLNLQVEALRLEKPPYDFEGAFRDAASGGAQMMLVRSTPLFLPHRGRIIEAANTHRLPSMFIAKHWARAGGLMAYGADFPLMYRRAAEYVAKILKGEKPANLPVEQASKFELVINLKTARMIDIELSTGILLRADEVIE